MKKAMEKTNIKGVCVKYSVSKKNGKQVFRAQLVDEFGDEIDGCKATYTLQSYDQEIDAKIAARNSAVEKFHRKFFQIAGDGSACETFFTEIWLGIPEDNRIQLAPHSREKIGSKKAALTYFEYNLLPALDRYGSQVDADHLLRVRDGLYYNALMSKKYKFCFVGKDEAEKIVELSGAMKGFLLENKVVRQLLGSAPEKKDVDTLIDSVNSALVGEDRLRSLLETALRQEADLKKFVVEKVWPKIEEDLELIEQLRGLKSTEKSRAAKEKLVFFMREISGNEEMTKMQVNVHIRDVNEILRNLAIASERPMPAISLPVYLVNRVPQIELCKELPWLVRVRFAGICMFLSPTSSEAVGAICMMTSGPRVAEICSVKYGDILDYGDWGLVVIRYTVKGEICQDEGKNAYYRRPIFFSKFAMDAIHNRQKELTKSGVKKEDLKRVYMINKDGDLFSPMNPSRFSQFVKKILKIAGCTDDYWESVRYAMSNQPDYDFFGRAEIFEIAYGLRRDATTMLCNVARAKPFKVDAILGHRIPRHSENWTKRITRDDEWPKIIAEMERIVYDPNHSNHPLFSPIDVSEPGTLSDVRGGTGYQGIAITAKKPVKVKLKIRTFGNSDIRLVLPKNCQETGSIDGIANTQAASMWLVGIHSREEYENVISQAIRDYLKEEKPDE